MYRRIVVGTDGSETSLAAVERAAETATEMKAELRVVVVYEQGHGADLAPIIARGGRSPELLGAVRKYTNARNAEPEFHLLAGDAADQVVALAREVGADLVVVGSVGMGGRKDAIKASIPTRITRNAPCDVLVVRTG
jgi:nucleotide-binding universal stress UspA family protein